MTCYVSDVGIGAVNLGGYLAVCNPGQLRVVIGMIANLTF